MTNLEKDGGTRQAPYKLEESQKRLLLGCLVEQLVRLVFSRHFYKWEGEIYRQISGGPIGLRASGVVGHILMDFWVKVIKKKSAESQIQHSKNPEIYESLKIHTLWKYVDDCVCILGKLRLGTRYVNGRLELAKKWLEEHIY